MKILGIDPGEKNIGVAISDQSATLARPLTVIKHISRPIDAATIAQLAAEERVIKIIVGMATDIDGKPNVSGRRAKRLAAAIRTQTNIPVEMWDESYSTQDARQQQIRLGVPQKKRRGHLDELAAAIILRTYLDAQNE